jgi:hypothetical protein
MNRSEYSSPAYKAARKALLADNPICHWCRRRPATEADHLVEVDREGTHADGLVPSCKPCNAARGATHRNKKLAAAKLNREKALNEFLHANEITPSPNLEYPKTSPNQPELAPTGHDQPRLETISPDGAGSFGPLVGDICLDALGLELMPWQVHFLNRALTFDDEGLLVHRSALGSVARQNGKSIILKSVILFWLLEMPKIRGEKQTIVSVAHRLDLAVMVFDDLADILENKYGAYVSRSYGRNKVTMPDGTTWWIKAAKHNAGHGMSIDLLIVDELFDVDAEVVEGGLMPAQRARKNPFALFMSTAGTEASVLFQRWREHGLRAIDSGQPTVNYMAEWSPPPHVDPMSPASWTWGNPAIGHTLTLDTLQQESENPDRASFLRASLNLWVTVARGWIAPGRWPELEHRGPIPMGGIIAIEASLDDSRYAAVRAVNLPDGRTVCTIAFVVDTIGELYDKLAEVAADPSLRFAMSPSIDAICPPNLERRRVIVGYAELGKLTPVVRDLINQGRLLHTGETMLAEHVQRAVAVKTQNTLVLSSQRSPGPIELARCMVWAAGMVARPAQSGRPMIVSV